MGWPARLEEKKEKKRMREAHKEARGEISLVEHVDDGREAVIKIYVYEDICRRHLSPRAAPALLVSRGRLE